MVGLRSRAVVRVNQGLQHKTPNNNKQETEMSVNTTIITTITTITMTAQPQSKAAAPCTTQAGMMTKRGGAGRGSELRQRAIRGRF